MKKMLFIYNIHSGKGNIKNNLASIIDVFNKNGYEVTVYSSQKRKHATELVKEMGADYDIVVCSGGDGTLSEVVDGIMAIEENKRPKVGYIPSGSTNDYAASLSIPTQMVKCARMITENNYQCVDVGKFQDEDYFIYVAAFGAFTEISWNTPQKEKNMLGHNAYILQGIKQFSGLKSYHVRFMFNNEEIDAECVYAMVYNAFSVGGFKNIGGTDIKLDDGKLNMMVVYTPDNAVEFSVLIADLLTRNPSSKYIKIYEVDTVEIECDNELEWVLDGEYGGSHKKVKISTVKNALEIAVPKDQDKNGKD